MTDGKVSSYGTANMDIRSFELNFEVNAVIYDEETTRKLEELFLEDLKVCEEITPERYEARSIFIRIKEQGSRLLSPLYRILLQHNIISPCPHIMMLMKILSQLNLKELPLNFCKCGVTGWCLEVMLLQQTPSYAMTCV